ncbi:MAG: SPASM domain-containing protein [Candidatus Saganbacteria bacterium]|nr:SPASM domain-containing protein [Candidatus Saganbacteria bacterium]
MAKITNKMSDDRTRLETVIPLETPYELQLAVASVCNFKCIYCPIHNQRLLKQAKAKKGVMDYALFTKIIDDLDDFPDKIKTLRLMREGEPFLNRRLADMVRYAKKKQPAVTVDTYTNGSLLTPEVSDALIAAGLDKLNISMQGMNAGAYKRLSGVDIDFDSYVKNIIYFCAHRKQCRVFIKVPDIGVTKSEEKEFFALFDKYADELFVERIFLAWPNFDVSHLQKDMTVGYYGQPKAETLIKVCTLPFYDLTVDYKGIVTACSIDWEEKTNLGDVKKQRLYEIWNGHKFNDFRRMQLRGERYRHAPCDKCWSLEYCKADDIDAYSNKLLEKFRDLP